MKAKPLGNSLSYAPNSARDLINIEAPSKTIDYFHERNKQSYSQAISSPKSNKESIGQPPREQIQTIADKETIEIDAMQMDTFKVQPNDKEDEPLNVMI